MEDRRYLKEEFAKSMAENDTTAQALGLAYGKAMFEVEELKMMLEGAQKKEIDAKIALEKHLIEKAKRK